MVTRGESGKQLIKICDDHMVFCGTHLDTKLCRGESGKQSVKICDDHMVFCGTHLDTKLCSKLNLNVNGTKISNYIC
jgi:hypothetical protein